MQFLIISLKITQLLEWFIVECCNILSFLHSWYQQFTLNLNKRVSQNKSKVCCPQTYFKDCVIHQFNQYCIQTVALNYDIRDTLKEKTIKLLNAPPKVKVLKKILLQLSEKINSIHVLVQIKRKITLINSVCWNKRVVFNNFT